VLRGAHLRQVLQQREQQRCGKQQEQHTASIRRARCSELVY
jgi:hypothetical protein